MNKRSVETKHSKHNYECVKWYRTTYKYVFNITGIVMSLWQQQTLCDTWISITNKAYPSFSIFIFLIFHNPRKIIFLSFC
jgi:hypothetical protein